MKHPGPIKDQLLVCKVFGIHERKALNQIDSTLINLPSFEFRRPGEVPLPLVLLQAMMVGQLLPPAGHLLTPPKQKCSFNGFFASREIPALTKQKCSATVIMEKYLQLETFLAPSV